jgi:hypothetical protein
VRRRRLAGLGLALLLALLLGVAAAATDPYLAYRSAHPEVGEDELLEVSAGDELERVLAVLHHPDAGFGPVTLDLWRVDREGATPVGLDAARSLPGSAALLGALRQRCPEAAARPPPFGSWFYLEDGRLAAWSLQPFTAACRREPALVEASDHRVMRVVGERLFRRTRRGEFRYGPLAYEEWSDAFAEPTRDAMLSRLQVDASEHSDDPQAQVRLAAGLYAVGERAGAVSALERAAALAPGWALPQRNLAVVHRQRGQLADADAAAGRADRLERALP